MKQFLQQKQALNDTWQNVGCIRTCEILIEQLPVLFFFKIRTAGKNQKLRQQTKNTTDTPHLSICQLPVHEYVCMCESLDS